MNNYSYVDSGVSDLHLFPGREHGMRISYARRICLMKKKFKVEVDCANCAAKMEAAVNKIEGVKEATISFMTQRLIIEADDARFDEIVQEAVKACKRVEPDCEIYV